MKVHTVTSPANVHLRQIRLLQERPSREKTGLFLLEGLRPVEEAINRNLPLDRIVVSQTYLDTSEHLIERLALSEVTVVEDKLFETLHGTTSSCGILATARMPKHTNSDLFKKLPYVLVICDRIQDPGNLGTIIRSAYAADVSGLMLTKGCVDPYSPKVVRSAVGSLFDTSIVGELTPDQCLSLLAEHEIPLLICDAGAQTPYFQANLAGPVALVFGNEARGIAPEFEQRCSGALRIPMREGSESLNVAVSAGIILSESFRQRSFAQS